jgi:hypothetical protein
MLQVQAFSKLTVRPITSRSRPVRELACRRCWRPTKPSISVGDPAIAPARLGTNPIRCCSTASGSFEPAGADSAVWMVNGGIASFSFGRGEPPRMRLAL